MFLYSSHESSQSKDRNIKENKSLLKHILRNVSGGSTSDFNRERLFTSILKQRLTKDKAALERKVSNKKSSKKKEDSKVFDSIKLNPFLTSDNRTIQRNCESKQSNRQAARSNSIDATKRSKEKRKRSSEYSMSFANTVSGKQIMRNASDHFTGIKPSKMHSAVATVEKLKLMRQVQKI